VLLRGKMLRWMLLPTRQNLEDLRGHPEELRVIANAALRWQARPAPDMVPSAARLDPAIRKAARGNVVHLRAAVAC